MIHLDTVPEFVGRVDRFTHIPWAEPSHPPEEDIRKMRHVRESKTHS
jgi:hypothetical protein